MKKLIIFDWAGTTVDFGCMAPVSAFVQAFNTINIKVTVEQARKPMGMLKLDHVKTMFAMEEIKKAFRKKYNRDYEIKDIEDVYLAFEHYLFKDLARYTDPIPQVIELIQIIKEKGIFHGSTTGYTSKMMEIVSVEAEKKGYAPDFIATADLAGAGRPDPAMIYLNMKHFNITEKSEVIKVGDTISDIQEAVNAGVCSIGILKGSSLIGLSESEWNELTDTAQKEHYIIATQKYKEAGADAVIETIDQLVNYLE